MPQGFQQIVLADDAIAILDEKGEQIERFRFQVGKVGAAAQFAALDIEAVLTKRQNHTRSPGPGLPKIISRR